LSYDATFGFKAGDVVGAEAMNGKKWDGGPAWIELGTVSGTSFSASGQTGFSTFTAFKSGVLSAALADFSAFQSGEAMRVSWETVSEVGNLGFNLWRGTSPNAPDVQLNSSLIPSQAPGSSQGFIYEWLDAANLVNNTTYFYWLEDVDIAGVVTRHGPISAAFAAPTAVRLTEAGRVGRGFDGMSVLLAGLALLAAALTALQADLDRMNRMNRILALWCAKLPPREFEYPVNPVNPV
ncbi:MAG: hypothetical protein WAV79_11870, partial [Anaerolineae bacterium]